MYGDSGGLKFLNFHYFVMIDIEISRLSKIQDLGCIDFPSGYVCFLAERCCILKSWIFYIFNHDNYDYWNFGILEFKII